MKSKKMVATERPYAEEQGFDAIWAGPLNMDNMPRGYGSSSGAKGIQLLLRICQHTSQDLLQKKQRDLNFK